MSVPVQIAIISLAAYRVWRLIGADVILSPLRNRLTHRDTYQHYPERYRRRLDEWLHCPWCLGFWISLAWWGAWYISPGRATTVAIPWAISAVVGLVAKNLDS